jgi:phenylpropionate dioxygenase-like ring-hydroxylating dioxygenase large terminal subunit
MFVKNAWYCAGWDYMITQGKNSIVARQLGGERVVLYRKPGGEVVAMEDRCPHRQAALSLGAKEGDHLRCMYHGMKFSPEGKCVEIPGQDTIPARACVRTMPVVERDNWVWVWMGEAAKADPALIPFAVGPGDPEWNMKTSHMHVDANYRLEIANLADLSHLAWVHQKSLGGADMDTRTQYTRIKARHTLLPRGVRTQYVVRGVPAPHFLKHLFPEDAKFDLDFDIVHTIPCTWVLHFQAHTQGTATEGRSNGEPVADTYTCQAVVPNDENSVEYYFSWGSRKTFEFPGLSDLLRDVLDIAFLEDRHVLEAQHVRMRERPHHPTVDIIHDAGPGKMLWVLDKLLKEEARAESASAVAA